MGWFLLTQYWTDSSLCSSFWQKLPGQWGLVWKIPEWSFKKTERMCWCSCFISSPHQLCQKSTRESAKPSKTCPLCSPAADTKVQQWKQPGHHMLLSVPQAFFPRRRRLLVVSSHCYRLIPAIMCIHHMIAAAKVLQMWCHLCCHVETAHRYSSHMVMTCFNFLLQVSRPWLMPWQQQGRHTRRSHRWWPSR